MTKQETQNKKDEILVWMVLIVVTILGIMFMGFCGCNDEGRGAFKDYTLDGSNIKEYCMPTCTLEPINDIASILGVGVFVILLFVEVMAIIEINSRYGE